MKKIIILLVLSVLLSCEEDSLEADALGANSDIVGTWIEDGYEEDITLLKRAQILDDSKYGFTLKDDGTFIERKNSGWCGTQPISYENFDGNWEAVSDSLIEITVGYWGGIMTYQLRIVSLDAEQLRVRFLYTEDLADAR